MWLLFCLHLVLAASVGVMSALTLNFLLYIPYSVGSMIGILFYILILALLWLGRREDLDI